MAFEQRSVGRVQVIRPRGHLDPPGAAELDQAVKDLLDAGRTCLLFDLGDLDHIGSAGLRVVLKAGKGARAGQGRLVLCGVRGRVRETVETSGLAALFPVVDDEPAALALFGS